MKREGCAVRSFTVTFGFLFEKHPARQLRLPRVRRARAAVSDMKRNINGATASDATTFSFELK